jgi:Xaa-Pro aminopeptidase
MIRRYAPGRRARRPFPANASGRPVNGAGLVQCAATMTQHLRAGRLASAVVIFALLTPLWTSAGPLQDDLKARRARVLDRVGPDTLAIFWSAPPRVFSNDVNYEYRQDSNLLYLTGVDQEDTILVLMPGNATRREILFIREADARREHWTGHTLTAAEATTQSGIAAVMTTSQFEPFVAAMLSQRAPAADANEYARFFDALKESRARVAVVFEPQTTVSGPLPPVAQFAASLRDRFSGFAVRDAAPVLAELRQVKTPYEQDLLRKSVAISVEAHRAGMRAAAPGKYEYEVEAAIEEVYLRNGAMSWGYPSIVGSGPNATILHYTKSTRRMEAGELLLVDAAGNYQGLTGDITRTYPVAGTFTREQREIYDIVLAAQEAGMKAATAGNRPRDIQAACDEVLRAGLARLGLVTDISGQQFKTWATHGVTHWIGMDVHDVGGRGPLAPGMAFTIEPGIYIREAALENLPRTPENLAFIEKVRPLVAKYKDIGVRIEDSYLLTPTGLESLSAGVPRTVDEIERFIRPAF